MTGFRKAEISGLSEGKNDARGGANSGANSGGGQSCVRCD